MLGFTVTQICDGLEKVMAKPEFVRHMNLRVASAVNDAVTQVLNTGSIQGVKTSLRYSEILGQKLTEIWTDIHTPFAADINGIQNGMIPEAYVEGIVYSKESKNPVCFCPFHHISMTKAVLYINSLGIRWNVLQYSPEYNLRVPMYICGFDERQKDIENNYNEAIFSEDSTHLLYAICKSSKSYRLLLSLGNDVHVPSKNSIKEYPFSIITLPLWKPTKDEMTKAYSLLTQLKRRNDKNQDIPFDRTSYADLEKILDWVRPAKIKKALKKVLFDSPNAPPNSKYFHNKYALLYVYNLYKHYYDMLLNGQKFPVTHFVYLPDLTCPSLTPAGYAGDLYCEGQIPTPSEYARLLCLMQRFFSNFFQQPVMTIESNIIQVAVDQGIRTEQTWTSMFTSLRKVEKGEEIPIENVPLLGSLKAHTKNGNNCFEETIKELFTSIHKLFIEKVWPSKGSNGTNKQAGFFRPNNDESLENILASPVFGYHALAQHAFATTKRLWAKFEIIDEVKYDALRRHLEENAKGQRRPPEEAPSILFLVEHLLFFEPTLHYIKSYRDHFMHSFNVLLLGYWLLSQYNDTTNSYFLFPHLKARERYNLLKCWTVTAPLHDIAYPLEKLGAGAKDLIKRFSNGGAERFDININPDWWHPLTQSNAFRFLQEILNDVTKEKPGLPPKEPLFIWDASMKTHKPPVNAAELASMLISLLLKNGNHGVTGALLLHNHFYEPIKKDGKIVDFRLKEKLSKKIFPDEQKKICVAVAFHHICDNWQSEDKDEIKQSQVEFLMESHHHELCYLLLLCDTLCQWGRNRVYDQMNKTQISIAKEEEEVESFLKSLSFNGECVTLEYDYPNVPHRNKSEKDETKDVHSFKKYFDKPFSLLSQGSPRVNKERVHVILYGKNPDGEGMYAGKNDPVESSLRF